MAQGVGCRTPRCRSYRSDVEGRPLGSAGAALRHVDVGGERGRADRRGEGRRLAIAIRSEREPTSTSRGPSRCRKDEAIPQAQVDTARSNAQASHAAVAQAQAQLAAAEDARRTAQTQIAEARGRVEQSAPVDAQLAVAKANADLAHARADAADAELALGEAPALPYTRISSRRPTACCRGSPYARGSSFRRASKSSASCRTRPTWSPTSRRPRWVACAPDSARRSRSTRSRAARSKERSTARLRGPARASRFFRPTTRPATSSKVVQRLPVKMVWVNAPARREARRGLSLRRDRIHRIVPGRIATSPDELP